MRLAVYCPDFFPAVGGYSFAFQDLVRGLTAEGVEVDVFTPVPLGETTELSLPRLRVIRVPPVRRSVAIKYVGGLITDWRNSRRMADAIARADAGRRYDALLSETIEDPLLLLLLPRALRERTVVRVHGCAETEQAMWDPALRWRVRRHLIRRALRRDIRFITATSEYYLEFVRLWFLDSNALTSADKRFAVVPNSAPSVVAQARMPAAGGRRRFLTLGRMTWVGTNQKGFDDILMALLELTPEERARIHLTIVGQGTERARLMRIAKEIPDAALEFLESAPNAEIRRLLGTVDGVLLASRYEGMAMFALEALGAGAPVIFSDVGGIGGLVRGNGRRFTAGDPRSLAAAWSELIAAEPEALAEMSRNSLRIAADLTPNRAAQALLRFLCLVRATG
ncbi:MAG: glycosyltransferase family 4 protein [Gemmatimonadota bacterium]|jgi:glycosyltransferase involved in cell wall biosynthesis